MKNNTLALGMAVLIVVVLLLFLFVSCNRKAKVSGSEKFFVGELGVDPVAPNAASVAARSNANPDMASSGIGGYAASDPLGNSSFNPVQGAPTAGAPTCFPRDRLSAEELLPKDAANTKWAQMNPAGQGDVSDKNFLTAGYHVGVNTVGQSLRNANYQLRSEPPNPQVPVSPWNISTIEPDQTRRPLEIAGDW
jgi:hypothetical protein